MKLQIKYDKRGAIGSGMYNKVLVELELEMPTDFGMSTHVRSKKDSVLVIGAMEVVLKCICLCHCMLVCLIIQSRLIELFTKGSQLHKTIKFWMKHLQDSSYYRTFCRLIHNYQSPAKYSKHKFIQIYTSTQHLAL